MINMNLANMQSESQKQNTLHDIIYMKYLHIYRNKVDWWLPRARGIGKWDCLLMGTGFYLG